MSHGFFPGRTMLRGIVAGIAILIAGSQATVQSATEPIKPSNTCRPLNLVAKNDGLYRKPFTPITPLIKSGDRVEKSSCAALLEQVQNSRPSELADLPPYQTVLNEFFSN